MKIGFIGAQGTGKTTMAYKVAYELKLLGHDVYVLSEVARSCPLPINQDTKKESQLWIMGKQITREQSARGKILVSDRTLLDSYSYSIWTDEEFFKHAMEFVGEYMNTYDFVFYLEPNDKYLLDDGTRDTDKNWRNEIDSIMTSLIDELNVKVIHVRDSDEVLNCIKKSLVEDTP